MDTRNVFTILFIVQISLVIYSSCDDQADKAAEKCVKCKFAASEGWECNENSLDPDFFSQKLDKSLLKPLCDEYKCSCYQSSGRKKRWAYIKDDINVVNHRWPNAVVKYKFGTSLMANQSQVLRDAMSHIRDQTIVDFKEIKSSEIQNGEPYLDIVVSGGGCNSFTGRVENQPQRVTLKDSCIKFGEMVNLLGTALGFFFPTQRSDAEQYMAFFSSNINPDEIGNFARFPTTILLTDGRPLDFGSIMGLNQRAGSVNGRKTNEPLDPNWRLTPGQRTGLSDDDREMFDTVYANELTTPCTGTVTCVNGGWPNREDNCESCRCRSGWTGTTCATLDQNNQNQGANFETCGGELTSSLTVQEITSPGYYSTQAAYPLFQECAWIIKAPEGEKLEAWFEGDFGLYLLNDACAHWAEIRNSSRFDKLGYRFCGPKRPDVKLEDDKIMVVLRANSTTSGDDLYKETRGFKLVFKTIGEEPPKTCTSANCINGGCDLMTDKCVCSEGYTGDRCDLDTDSQCADNPCHNGGTCYVDDNGNMKCLCPGEFHGHYCNASTSCGACMVSPGVCQAPCSTGQEIETVCKQRVRVRVCQTSTWWGWQRTRCHNDYKYQEVDCIKTVKTCCDDPDVQLFTSGFDSQYCARTGWSNWTGCTCACGGCGIEKRQYYEFTNTEPVRYVVDPLKKYPNGGESRACGFQPCTSDCCPEQQSSSSGRYLVPSRSGSSESSERWSFSSRRSSRRRYVSPWWQCQGMSSNCRRPCCNPFTLDDDMGMCVNTTVSQDDDVFIEP